MSTQEIGALIESVNEMTATVAGKMGEIDDKVEEATNAVPSTVNSLLFPSPVYVDAINGNDNNSGSPSSPKRTLKGALANRLPLSIVVVFLARGQTHIYSDSFEQTFNVEIRSWGNGEASAWLDSAAPELHFTHETMPIVMKNSVYLSIGRFHQGIKVFCPNSYLFVRGHGTGTDINGGAYVPKFLSIAHSLIKTKGTIAEDCQTVNMRVSQWDTDSLEDPNCKAFKFGYTPGLVNLGGAQIVGANSATAELVDGVAGVNHLRVGV
ncbi:TPA: hypothetical protein P0E17_004240 [Vibrio campbellii]|nr:hypothetical protein [Vibrio campbellii]